MTAALGLAAIAAVSCDDPKPAERVAEAADEVRVELHATATGSDATGDGTVAHPFRTVRKAIASIPADAGGNRYVVDCTDLGVENVGSLDLPFVASNQPLVPVTAGNLAFAFEGALTLQAAPTPLVSLPSNTTSFTFDPTTGIATLKVQSTNFAKDQWRGKLIMGSGRGQAAVIASNTASCVVDAPGCPVGQSELQITTSGAQGLGITLPLTISEPSCELRNADNGSSTLTARGLTGSLAITGLRISHANPLISALTLNTVNQVRVMASDIDGISVVGGTPVFAGCRFQGGTPIAPFPAGHRYRRMARAGSGGYSLQGCYLQDLEFGSSAGGATASLSTSIVDGCSYLGENAIEAYDGAWFLKGVQVLRSPHHGFISGGGAPNWVRNVRIDDSLGDAIHADGVGETVIANVQGSGNHGYGVRAENGAQVVTNMSSHVGGGQGDLSVGSRATRSYEDFRSELPLRNEADFSPETGDGSRIYQEETCCGVWAHLSAGDSHEFAAPHAVRLDKSGNVLFVGRTSSSSLSFAGGALMPSLGAYDGFVVKLSSAGTPLWSKRLGGPSQDMAYAVASDQDDNVYVAGAYVGPVNLGGSALPTAGGYESFVVKLAPDGSHIWSIGLATPGEDVPAGLAVDPNGDVYVIGARDWAPYGTTGDLTLHKLSGSNGGVIWSKSMPSVGGDAGTGVDVDAAGELYITGAFGNPSGGSLDLGGTTLVSANVRRGFVAKLHGVDGAHVWSKSIEESNQSDLNAVVVDDSGTVIVAGATRGPGRIAGGPTVSVGGEYDFFIAGLSAANGSHRWSRAHGGPGNEIANDLALAPDGSVVAVGQLGSANVNFGGSTLSYSGSSDIVVARYDRATGNHISSLGTGDSGDDVGFGVAVRPDTNNVHVAGHTNGNLNFWRGSQADPLAQYGYFIANLGAP